MSATRLFYAKVLAIAFTVFSARLWLIDAFGVNTPLTDQWLGQAEQVFMPWLHAELTFSQIFSAYNEHRPAWMRLFSLYLLILNQ